MSTAQVPDAAEAAGRWTSIRRRWRDPRVRDAALALALTAVLIWGSYHEAHPANPSNYFTSPHHVPYTPTAAYLLVAAACLPLAFRRRWPATVLAVSTAAVAVYSLLGYVNGAALVAPIIALYSLATRVSVRRAIAWALATLAALLATTLAANPFGGFGGGFDTTPFLVAAACFAGLAVGNRRAYVDSLRDRAEADARRRIDEERLRIARELHDVVAHTMATINVQAGAAAHVLTDRPDKAAESLAAIRAASKEGLRELRAILNVLRQADEATDPTQPAPGLARLDALAAGTRQAGLPVTVTVTGQPRPLPGVTDLAAYRIIQEALTNSIRHAGPATAAVSLTYGDTDLRIEVTDTGHGGQNGVMAPGGPPTGGGGSGHGLRGMRERAAAADGTIEIGPAPVKRDGETGGGFRVAARLPYGGQGQVRAAPPEVGPARGQRTPSIDAGGTHARSIDAGGTRALSGGRREGGSGTGATTQGGGR